MFKESFTGTIPVLREVVSTSLAPRVPVREGAPPALGPPAEQPPNRARSTSSVRRGIRIRPALALDLVVLTASTLTALLVSALIRTALFADAELYTPVILVVLPLWVTMIALVGGYRGTQLTTEAAEYRSVLEGSLLTAGVLGVSAYLLEYPMSRTFFVNVFLIGIPAALLGHIIRRRLVKLARTQGKYRSRILVAGDREHIEELVTVLERERWLGYDPVGLLTEDIDTCQESLTVPVVGTPDHVVDAVRRTHVDSVIFAEGAFPRGRDFNVVARQLEHERTRLIVVPAVNDVAAARLNVRPVAGIPLVHIEKPRAAKAGCIPKRAIDIVGSLFLILATAPILAAAALAIKIEDRGPVIFRQRRVGFNGEVFECLKLRSMVTDAEKIRARTLTDQNESDGLLFKMKRDPRITRVGRFIRRFSIDELPQFINVLKGEMSLVGPRPALEAEVAQYTPQVLRRLDVRPGLTGLWQVSGRSDLSWEDTVRLDLYYVDNWSMFQDATILARTAKAVVGSDGAY